MYSDYNINQRFTNFFNQLDSENKSDPRDPMLAYIKIKKSEKPDSYFYFCLDSGSSSSFLHIDVAKQLNLQIDYSKTISYTVADGSEHATLGLTKVTIPFPGQNFTIQIEMHTVEGLPTSALIGLNVLKNFLQNFPDKKLVHPNGKFLEIFYLNPCVSPYGLNKNGSNYTLQTGIDYAHLPAPVVIDYKTYKIYPITGNGEIETDDPDLVQGPIINYPPEMLFSAFENNQLLDKPDSSVCDINDLDINPDLPRDIKNQYKTLLLKYSDLFIYSSSDIGRYNGSETFSISVTTDRPQRGATYSIPVHMKQQFLDHIEDLIKLDLIEPSNNLSYNHGMIPVTKKRRKIHPVVFRLS